MTLALNIVNNLFTRHHCDLGLEHSKAIFSQDTVVKRLLCNVQGQGQGYNSKLHLTISPIFSVPLISLQQNQVCECTIINNQPQCKQSGNVYDTVMTMTVTYSLPKTLHAGQKRSPRRDQD